MQVATWNVNSLTVRLPQVLAWLQDNPVDVLALQETKLPDERFPFDALAQAGYQAQCFGQKAYNGVALLTRTGVTEGTDVTGVTHNIPGFVDPSARVISAHVMGVRVVCVYVPNGQAPDTDKFDYKMAWLAALHDWIASELAAHPRLVLLGDFNITFDDADVWDPIAMQGQICCTDSERRRFRNLLALGLTDAFRLFAQPPYSYSWWDYRSFRGYRGHGLAHQPGMRIDHILFSQSLKPHVTRCWIDKRPRHNERPSDHAPVAAEIGL